LPTNGLAAARDLADSELWELSLGRSRARRRAAQLRFVPAGSRAKRLSLGTLAALTVGPASTLGEATAAQHGRRQVPAVPPTTENRITLQVGSNGAQVRNLQTALHIKVDGVYGPETEGAVDQYQAMHGLQVDGIVGPATSGAIANEAHTKKPSASDAVSLVQAALGAQVDGEYGPETYEAISAFQASHRLNVDGVVGPETWSALHVDGGQTLNPPASALPRPEPVATVVSAPAEGGGAPAEGAAPGGGTEAVAQTAVVSNPGEGSGGTSGATVESGAPEQAAPATEAGAPTSGGGGEGGGASAPESSEASGTSQSSGASPSGGAGGGGEGGSSEGQATTGGEGSGVVRRVVGAANEIATRPYVYGGGHGSFNSEGYDCSGSVSYALHGGGLIHSPEASGELESYGEAGPGKHITIYANSEHAYMEVNGRRYDTVALAEHGSRWSNSSGSDGGSFVARHPSGY
jgi:peptidoglycan hydrolase-like protein with peptidoglycan-binding domain